MGTFTFNGTDSSQFGLRVTSDYVINSTGQDIDTVAVAGRDGDLLLPNNRLKSVTIELPCTIMSNRKLTDAESGISNWLNVAGYKDLTLSWDPDFIYRSAFIETFEIAGLMRQFGKVKLNFLTYPVKFYKQGRTTQTLSNGATVNGIGNVNAKPIITLVGSGDCTLTINGRKTKLRAVQNTITLDMQARQVFSGNLPAWDKVVRAPQYQMPYLDAGRNLISWDGSFTAEMIPNWGVKL
ncbi:distal tail protein Dit [Streptococcus parasanguinis]|mgnify:FL=1|uniref:distal tail protein Dit n=1 Tax=Streptococcus parasanguinis TaxID=1318 RepID=UPI001BE57815|nr:distal tail protein Dit [Streptococcus parasanguinis]MBT3138377.1 phage tail family protein [Streptococcus parasanguinis]